MSENFIVFSRRTIHNFTTATVNLFIFLPYFFSVSQSLRTLFAPWKNIRSERHKPGFSFEQFFGKLGDEFASRFMGFMLRSSILFAYLTAQIAFVLLLPLAFIFMILITPILYVLEIMLIKPEAKRKALHEHFIKRHLIDEKNMPQVEEWFELYWQKNHNEPWWKLDRLFATPPLGRDWTAGYTPTLDQYAAELTIPAAHHKNLIGRTQELQMLQQALLKSKEANVVLVGPEGVGKRTIVEAFAKALYEGKSNNVLAYRRILELNLEKLLATSTDFHQREETIDTIFAESAKAGNIILFIEGIDRYISTEADHVNLTQVLAKYAVSPHLHFVVTTTPTAYQKYVYSNELLNKLFETVEIQEMNTQTALTICLDGALSLEKRHSIAISYEAIVEAVNLTDRLIRNQPLPEKAINILDEACVYAQTQRNADVVTPDHIRLLLQQKTHVPTSLNDEFRDKLSTLEKLLHQTVIAQDSALQEVSSALRNAFVLNSNRKKPFATFLFLGPTGVGKTQTAKAIARVFFGNDDTIVRFDMSLYQSKTDIPKLIGDGQTKEPGLLTTAIRQKNYGLLLLDEIEKADHDLLNIFLTILDEGYYTNGAGEPVDCKNLIIVATSNAGADYLFEQANRKTRVDQNQLVSYLVQNHLFLPEFLNRFDGVVVYQPLDTQAITQIAQSIITSLSSDLTTNHKINLQVTPTYLQSLIAQSYDQRFGARNMQRIIKQHIEDTIAKGLLDKTLQEGQTIVF